MKVILGYLPTTYNNASRLSAFYNYPIGKNLEFIELYYLAIRSLFHQQFRLFGAHSDLIYATDTRPTDVNSCYVRF